ncbi:hypothetical protein GCM10010528_17030 [Gordonia defluvii]|uniref:Uncharacterized protein n=1 Tax=Gordonia defluvii TaxID=283718 RepID=A0ABP6LEQ3_9ACTN|nr:hypothetical protein [Gordonia sp. UBA5067]
MGPRYSAALVLGAARRGVGDYRKSWYLLLVLLVAALCGVAIREVWSLAESG